jgi:hypothetical protein
MPITVLLLEDETSDAASFVRIQAECLPSSAYTVQTISAGAAAMLQPALEDVQVLLIGIRDRPLLLTYSLFHSPPGQRLLFYALGGAGGQAITMASSWTSDNKEGIAHAGIG